MDQTLAELRDHIALVLKGALTESKIAYGELTLAVARDRIVEALTRLRDDADLRFEQLIDLCGVDYPARPERFDVVYHLLSPRRNVRLRVKVATDEMTPVTSVIEVFPAPPLPLRTTISFMLPSP